MTIDQRRRTTTSDYMMLIVGMAFAFTAWRFVMSMEIWRNLPDSLQRYYFQALGGVAFLVPLSLTLFAVASRQAGPPARRVLEEPAGVLGVTVSFVLLINTLLLLTVMLLAGWSAATFTGGKVLYYCRLIAEQTGMALGAVSLGNALGRRGRRPSGWLDIAAWALGAVWATLALASAAFTLM